MKNYPLLLLVFILTLNYQSFASNANVLNNKNKTGIVQTLCEEYENIEFDLIIGAGTPIYNSTQLGSNISSLKINVIGDFIVDKNFLINSCILKIEPSVKLIMTDGSSLRINDSKLFSCNDLWDGINAGNECKIYFDNVSIEDANNAISSINKIKNYFNIENSFFNRNYTSIHLEKEQLQEFQPILRIYNNDFTCDSPLNGTIDQVSYTGIRLIHTSLFDKGSKHNLFSDLQFGIISTGVNQTITSNNAEFNNIYFNGIDIADGNLNVENTTFDNCQENAIKIDLARNKSKIAESIFRTDENLIFNPNPNGFDFYSGIQIQGFGLNSYINIQNNQFISVGLPNTGQQMSQIRLVGGNVGSESVISISSNIFHLTVGGFSNSITITNFFPETSNVHIFNNNFDVSYDNNYIQVGVIKIEDGDKSNFEIWENNFYAQNSPLGRCNAIILRGSEGVNNYFGQNNIPVDYSASPFSIDYKYGLRLENFKNTKICNNVFGNNFTNILFGDNLGTDLEKNYFIGGGERIKLINSIIGPQSHKGNEFLHRYFNEFPTDGWAICTPASNADENLFTIHTEQSSDYLPGPPWYDFYSEFFPWHIVPDTDDDQWFITDLGGTPASGCNTMLTGEQTNELYENISDNLFNGNENNPATTWSAKNFLYKKLKTNSALASQYIGFSTFLSNNSNTNIGAFYTIKKLIEDSHIPDSSLIDSYQLNQSSYLVLIEDLDSVNQIIANTSNQSILESSLVNQRDIIENISTIKSNLNSLTNNYSNSRLQVLDQAYLLNQSVYSNDIFEINLKEVIEIYLSSYLYQNGNLSNDQIIHLKSIASQCPHYGGIAVHYARGIIPTNEKELYDDYASDCYSYTENSELSIVSENRNSLPKNLKNSSSRLVISPNPNKGKFNILFGKNVSGSLQIYNLSGKVIYSSEINSNSHFIDKVIPSGTYIVKFQIPGEEYKSSKIIIID